MVPSSFSARLPSIFAVFPIAAPTLYSPSLFLATFLIPSHLSFRVKGLSSVDLPKILF
jgi:hypothetical protein